MVLVFGATGTVGTEVVRALRAQSVETRGLVRAASKAHLVERQGAEAAVGDLEDRDSLESALAGAEAAFLVTPTNPKQVQWEGNAIDAARAAGASLVKLSVVNADPEATEMIYRIHGEAERLLRQSGLDHTVLRCNEFMQNLLLSAETIADPDGRFFGTAVGGRGMGMVDVRDVAAAGAAVLTAAEHRGDTHLMTGPEALSFDRAAAQLTSALGRTISYVELPADEYRTALVGDGAPAWLADAFLELYASFGRGMAECVTTAVRDLTGTEPRSLERFARDHRDALSAG